jgi:CBS domain-containing protein
MKVSEIMVSELASCAPQTSLHDIAMLMWNNDCGAVPLVDEDEHPVGIVTDRDIAMGAALKLRPLWEIRGDEIARERKLYCVHQDDSITYALELMEQYEVRRLPVINQFNQLCGIVSMGDIVSFARTGRTKKGQISATDTLDLLKHVSGHHVSRKAMTVS